MKEYRSHKIVKAGKIEDFQGTNHNGEHILVVEGGERVTAPTDIFKRGYARKGDYVVQYDDGYMSWSPAAAFEAGYTVVE